MLFIILGIIFILITCISWFELKHFEESTILEVLKQNKSLADLEQSKLKKYGVILSIAFSVISAAFLIVGIIILFIK